MCILSCFVWLKYVLFNILCVFGALDLHKKFTRRVDNVPTRHTTLFLLSFTNYSSGFFFNLWNVTLLVYATGACLCVLWPRKCCNLSSCRKFISCNCVHCSKYAVVCFSCRSLLASWISQSGMNIVFCNLHADIAAVVLERWLLPLLLLLVSLPARTVTVCNCNRGWCGCCCCCCCCCLLLPMMVMM